MSTPASVSGSVAHSAPIDWSQRPLSERMAHVMHALVTVYGYSVNGAAGIVGNLAAESGVIPNRIEGSSAATPMRAKDAGGHVRDFTAEQIKNRVPHKTGPALPGVGLAQWTSATRRANLYAHKFNGTKLGASIIFDMDAEIDFLNAELTGGFAALHSALVSGTITLNDASDKFLLKFEAPANVGQAQKNTRRTFAQQAVKAHQSQP